MSTTLADDVLKKTEELGKQVVNAANQTLNRSLQQNRFEQTLKQNQTSRFSPSKNVKHSIQY